MEKKSRLVLLDGMALIYRAHFALYKHPRLTRSGLNTGPIFGFTNTLLDVVQKLEPTHLVTTFDSHEPTWRHEAFTEYKQHREAQPEAITDAIPYIHEILEGFGIPTWTMAGQEADDLMGSLAHQAVRDGFDVYLVTPDKDLGQLVNEHIFLYKPALSGKPGEVWTEKEVKAHWGIQDVDQVRDIIALWGDASDNIPGVRGIGQKRAQQLIQQFHSLENLLAQRDKLKGSMKRYLQEQEEIALLSKKLATIRTDLPLTCSWEESAYTAPQAEKLLPIFEKLEFRTLAKRLFQQIIEPKSQLSLFGSALPTTQEEEPQERLATYDPKKAIYRCLETLEECKKLVHQLQKEKVFCFDTETTGLNALEAELLGISFSSAAHEAFYIPFPKGSALLEKYRELLCPLFADQKIMKVGHHLKYDITMLHRQGIRVEGPCFDTMIAHHLLAPEGQHGLDALAKKYLEYAPIPITSLIGEKGKNQKNMADVPLADLFIYASEDADITFQLYGQLCEAIEKEKCFPLFRDVEMPLIPILVEMERKGVALDTDILKKISAHLTQDLEKLTEEIHNAAGFAFNIDSPKQLGEVLFDQMKIVDKAAKTSKGQYITNEAVLSKLRKKHAIIPYILDYREMKKLKSTYVDKLGTLVSDQDGRLHTSFQQGIVTSGRLSSTNPNLQNIPIRTERGRLIRKAFVAPDSNHTLLCADYSQIELRLMAHFSQDPQMIAAFEKGEDIHAATAAQVFELPESKISPEMRRQAKMINFGIIYGISAFGLAQRLNISNREAQKIIEAYFKQFPKVKTYMEEIIAQAKEQGYVETLMGRRRFLADINSRNATTRGLAERNAINMPIQGTAAELIKGAMVEITRWLEEKKMKSNMILQVHDELVFEVPNDELDSMKSTIPTLMERNPGLRIPLVATLGRGANWLEAH